jgi:hypothetical protein
MSFDERAFLEGRIARKLARIEQLDAAITALAGGAQSYQLDTGQTRQMVTKIQYAALVDEQRSLEHDVLMLRKRLCGGGSIISRPGF